MSAIRGTIRNGQVVLDNPVDWPEGTRVEFVATEREEFVGVGMREDEQGDDPESIARWLAAFDAIPVAATAPSDDPAVTAWQKAMRDHNREAMRKQMQESPE
ncbi:MAG: hypothetical protein K2V38_17900 [Gemmataceae bacterium]|nr:hypothetical protein [Gemmataceae bacterium]